MSENIEIFDAQDKIAETLKLVDDAQSKNVFDITAYAKGRLAPQDTVTAYLDIESAYALTEVGERLRSTPAGPEYDALEAQAEMLSTKILESKVVFHMRGVVQDVVEQATIAANAKYPTTKSALGVESETSPEWIKYWTCSLIAANLIKVVNAKGEEDTRVFTVEDTMEMRAYLPREIWDMLVEKMQQLSLASAYFKGLTDAGFLPKS